MMIMTMMMVMVMMVVVVMAITITINQALNTAKVLDVAGDGDGALLIESVLLFGLFQQLQEQWVVCVRNWDYKLLQFFLSFVPHHHCHAPFRHTLDFIPALPMMLMMMEVGEVELEAHMVFFTTTHVGKLH